MEIFNIVKEVVLLIVSIVGVWFAGNALYTWKKEFIGKKKIDLACDIVEQVCNMQDLINHARIPVSFVSEQKEIKEELKKDDVEIKENKLFYLVAKHRILKHREEIEKFFSLRNKAQLYWNKEILDLFEKLNFVFQLINDASETLYSTLMQKNDVEKAKKIIFNSYEKNDEIVNKVQKIVDEFKLNLEPLYKDRLTTWKKLSK